MVVVRNSRSGNLSLNPGCGIDSFFMGGGC